MMRRIGFDPKICRLSVPFVDVNTYKKDKTRQIAQKTLVTMLKSITGIFYLGGDHEIKMIH